MAEISCSSCIDCNSQVMQVHFSAASWQSPPAHIL